MANHSAIKTPREIVKPIASCTTPCTGNIMGGASRQKRYVMADDTNHVHDWDVRLEEDATAITRLCRKCKVVECEHPQHGWKHGWMDVDCFNETIDALNKANAAKGIERDGWAQRQSAVRRFRDWRIRNRQRD